MAKLQIGLGGTRFVVLWGDKAYKIARSQLAWCFVRFFYHVWKGQLKERLEYCDPQPVCAGWKRLFPGVRANLDEWYISRHHPSPDIAQVLGIHCFGFILVQERGEALPEWQNPEKHRFWLPMLSRKGNDAKAARAQFARFGESVKLVDFGRDDLDLRALF